MAQGAACPRTRFRNAFGDRGTAPVAYAMKDLNYALELAAEADIDAAGADLVKAWFDETVESGLGERYPPVVATLVDHKQST